VPAPNIGDRQRLLNFIIVMEATLLLTATVWCQISNIDLRPGLHGKPGDILVGAAVGLGLAFSSVLMYWVGKFPLFKWMSGTRELVTKLMGPLFADATTIDILFISLISGFCEEVLFRGVIQEQWGLFPASVIFGVLHTAGPRYPHYPIWAFTAALIFGGMYGATHSLWPPIVAHITNNFLGLCVLRKLGKRTATESES
jgi:hypothetical protein